MKLALRSVLCLVVITTIFAAVGCKSSKPQAETVPVEPSASTPARTPAPTLPEEVVETPQTGMIVSEEVTEELPDDLAQLNARGFLEDAFFDTDRFDLKPEFRESLARNADWLQQHPSIQILVEGHCDERNTREYNLALGERRAAAVRDYLVFLGIDASRIRTISYGEERPFAVGRNEEAWQLNRRAHFVITAR
jgi:peptidoglycan-associated lipoprotein